ncbi:MAG: hypothetical protein ACM339_01110 [Ignavibacteria bacterium]
MCFTESMTLIGIERFNVFGELADNGPGYGFTEDLGYFLFKLFE